MIPAAIFGFLVGAVLAWGFRVWILVPITLVAFLAKLIFDLLTGTDFLAALESSLVIGVVPQLGYAFGLVARGALVVLRSPRRAPAAILNEPRSINGA